MTEHQLLKADKDIDYRDAKKTLKLYLKERSKGIKNCQSWARWTYGNIPFWSVWGLVYGWDQDPYFRFCGIHIYDDGRVEIVSSRVPADIENKEEAVGNHNHRRTK